MKVWGITLDEARDVARAVGVELYEVREDGRALRFTLRPTGERDEDGNYRYQRVSASVFQNERRVHAVCWHGHRDYMLGLFEVNPGARVKTSWADYRGLEDFEASYRDTAWTNIGSSMYPVAACEACRC